MDMVNLIGGQSAGAVKRWVPLRRISAFGSGNIIIPSTVPIGSRIRVTVQGPGGAGAVATVQGWPGAGGGSGGRARKIYTVNPGDSFPYVVGRGGQTAGAAGTAATTFGSGGNLISGGPGLGGTATTAANQLGGAGGAASGGDENQAGAVGGGSNSANYMYCTGSSGAGAPMTTNTGLVAGTPGRISNTTTYNLSWGPDSTSSWLGGVHQGGGRGGYIYQSYASAIAGFGKHGGGGGGTHGYTSISGGVANSWGKGGDGYLSIEIETSLPAGQQLLEVDSPNTAAVYPANAIIAGLPEADLNFSSPGVPYPYRQGLAVSPAIIYAGVLVNEISIFVSGVWRMGRFSIYDSNRSLLYTGVLGGNGGGSGWYTLVIPGGIYLEKGFYFISFSTGLADFSNIYETSNPNVGTYNFNKAKGGTAVTTAYPDVVKLNMATNYDGYYVGAPNYLQLFQSSVICYNIMDTCDCNFYEAAPAELPPLEYIGGYGMPAMILKVNG